MPAISIDDVTVDESAGTATFHVTLTNPSADAISVDYATADGSATAGLDYTATSGTLNFAAGEVSKTITVAISEDTIYEGDETFTVDLSGAVNATIADNQGLGTIEDNESEPTLSIDNVTVNEEDGTALFTVTLSGESKFPVTVDFATADGSATAGQDYTTTSGTLTFDPGVTTQTIAVSITDDTLYEGVDETFYVNLSNPSNATIADNQGLGTIVDNDPEANDDAVTTNEDMPVIINVLANDRDANSDPLNVVVLTAPAHGMVVANLDGTVTYTPDLNYSGIDSFTYQVDDGNGNTDSAAVTITVNPVVDYLTEADVDLQVAPFEIFSVSGDDLPQGYYPSPLALDGVTLTGYDNGAPVSQIHNSNGTGLGVYGGNDTTGADKGTIDELEQLEFKFDSSVTWMQTDLKNTADEVLYVTSKDVGVEVSGTTATVSGEIFLPNTHSIPTSSSVLPSPILARLTVTDSDGNTTTSGPVAMTFTESGGDVTATWSVTAPIASGATIVSSELEWVVDGSFISNGGAVVELTMDGGFDNMIFGHVPDATLATEFGLVMSDPADPYSWNDGYQVFQVTASSSATPTYPIDINALLRDQAPTDAFSEESFVSLAFGGFPSGTSLFVGGVEILPDADGNFTISDLSLLTNSYDDTTPTFYDNIEAVTTTLLPADFEPTVYLTVQDGTEQVTSIIGGTYDADLTGGSGSDYLDGNAVADAVVANGGNFTLEGGDGDDFIQYNPAATLMDGGAGSDTLLISESGALDFSNVHNIEKIDLSDGATQNITDITVQDVFDMTTEVAGEHALVITGDSGSDHVALANDGVKDWSFDTSTAPDSHGMVYDVYSYTDLLGIKTTVMIQQDINDTTI